MYIVELQPMAYALEELIDLSLLQRLVDEIHQTLHVSASIIGADDRCVALSGRQNVCTMLQRADPEAKPGCDESNQHVWEQVDGATSPAFHRCTNGLVCAAVPIMVQDRRVASFVIGQVFLEPWNEETLRIQAWELGLDEDEYLAEARKVPLITEEVLERHLAFVAVLARMLAQIGHERLQLIETSSRLNRAEAMGLDLAARRGLLVAPSFSRSMVAISKLGELRDPYTAGHQRQVRNWACAISTRLGLDNVDMIVGALLHDVGKICVPVEILTKPGALTPEEYEILKEHPWYGYEIAKEIELSETIQTMIYQHHERLDGTGYPLGLKDKEIVLDARILAVADVVDSITSDRPYRAARSIDAAVEELKMYRGIRYDAQVVDACLEVIREYGGITPPFEDYALVSRPAAGRLSTEPG
jgi:putative nucleotidyltransferase with HDIG domain